MRTSMSDISDKSFEKLVEEHLNWLIVEYGFVRQPVPESQFTAGRIIKYASADYAIFVVRELFEVACDLKFADDEITRYDLALIVGFIEKKFVAGNYSGTDEEQVRRIAQKLRKYAPQIFGSAFLKIN